MTYNNLLGLKNTVLSVQKSKYPNIEHLIVDGNSGDGTKDFLDSIKRTDTSYLSESDNGIYDAMNKGIKLAKGEWIIFMNAGDTFSNSKVLNDISFPEEQTVLYGNCQVTYPTGFSRLLKAKSLSSFWQGLPFSHQTVLIPRKLLEGGFDIGYRFCADFDLLYRLYLNDVNYMNTDLTIADITAGGVSDDKRYLATIEVYRINKKLKKGLRLASYFYTKIILSWLVVKIKQLLPSKWVTRLYKMKYQ